MIEWLHTITKMGYLTVMIAIPDGYVHPSSSPILRTQFLELHEIQWILDDIEQWQKKNSS